jgi:RimJ/RimL family protein N-acetyltransferase
VAWKLGFSFDGTVERWLAQRGDLLDAWVGALHVDDERAPRGEWLIVPRLLGDHVVLRGFRQSDAERVAQACDDERTAHWMWRMPHPYTLADALDYIESRTEQLATGSGITWAVADPATDELLGSLSAVDLKPQREAELGYWTHPDARGRGVMTEACGLVVRHCLSPYGAGGLGLQRLFSGAADGNTASVHVLEANGFTRVSRERRALRLRDGRLVDQLGYDLLAEELPPHGG